MTEKKLKYGDEEKCVEVVIGLEVDENVQKTSDKLLKMMGFGDQAKLRRENKEKMKQWSAEHDRFLLSRQKL